ncbi:MAG: ATP-binding protein [Ktedonobacteraceae bacterium]
MSVEARFSDVAQQMCSLVGCDWAYVFLGCQEPVLRHPLLDLLSTSGYDSVAWAGPPSGLALLQHEQIRVLCDVALQTGHIQTVASCSLATQSTVIHSLAVVPLERPAGVMGFLLLADARPGAFYYGELLLLRQYVPRVASNLERELRSRCAVPFYPNFRGGSERTSQRESFERKSGKQTTQLVTPDTGDTEHAQLDQQRQELDRLKNEFISMVSHELRTPLTAIKGYAVLLQTYGVTNATTESDPGEGEMTPARQREYLDIIMEQTSHLEVLISDLLDVSRIHASRLSLRRSQVDMAALCQRVVQLINTLLYQQYPERYIIDCRLAPDLPLVFADSDRVQQVLTNLLENAVKYSPDGGPIEVIVAPRPPLADPYGGITSPELLSTQKQAAGPGQEMVYVTVRDQGIGISPDQQSHLFKPFSRLEHPLTGDIPGAGLGLYITHKLIEAMGGSVTLTSRMGAGTSVTFTLPVAISPGTSNSGQVPMHLS